MKLVDKIKENKIFQEVKKCDNNAFIKAYDIYSDQIYRFIFFKVNNKEEAQDITSAVFLKAWNYLRENSVIEEKTLGALFYKIARNTIIDYYRKNSQVTSVSLDNPETKIDIKDETLSSEDQADINLQTKNIDKKLLLLKDEYREILIMKFTEELSTAEIASIMKKTKGNVRITTFRALKALRELMEEDAK
jgi:RNA polymerase sigma-70 factor (ECF subfamily)